VKGDAFPGCGVLALRGELDVTAVAELSSELADVMSRGRWVIVDLAGLSFIDCASVVVVLAGARDRMRLAGGDVLLAGARGGVARLLELTGWDEVFSVFPGAGPAAFSAGLAAFSARVAERAVLRQSPAEPGLASACAGHAGVPAQRALPARRARHLARQRPEGAAGYGRRPTPATIMLACSSGPVSGWPGSQAGVSTMPGFTSSRPSNRPVISSHVWE
jgi:anti-sigma B factor antagonist